MNSSRQKLLPFFTFITGLLCPCAGRAAESASPILPAQLASRLATLQEDGSSYVRLRMQINGATQDTFQLQIKSRRTAGSSEIVYQVLWPVPQKGEAVLLRQTANHAPTGVTFNTKDGVRPLRDLKEPLLGSDLACADVIENFFAWKEQAILGGEDLAGVKCQILESKPGKGDHSIYGSVRSWIDAQRLVPMRVEKYSTSGQMVRRIDTTRVVTDGAKHIPADLVVHGQRGETSTVLAGSRIKHDVAYTNTDFSEDGLRELGAPHGGE